MSSASIRIEQELFERASIMANAARFSTVRIFLFVFIIIAGPLRRRTPSVC